MKALKRGRPVLLLLLMAMAIPAAAYEVVLSDGRILACTQPPSCQGKICVMRTEDGRLVSEINHRINFEATEALNQPQASAPPDGKAESPRVVRRFTNRDLERLDAKLWGKNARVIRNVDLQSIPWRSEVTGRRRSPPSKGSEDLGYSAVTDAYGRGRRYWRERVATLNRELERTQARLELNRRELAESSRALLFGRWISPEPVEGDRIPTFGILEYPRTPVERAVWLHRITESQRRVRRAEMELELKQKEQRELFNEARRAGALTGWLTQP